MKKLSFSLLAASTLVFAGCSSDEPLANADGYQDGMVTFNVTMPSSISSRAVADGQSAKNLTYVVYKDDVVLFQKTEENVFVGKQATVQIPLVNGITYDVAFIATSPSSKYTIEDGKLKVNYDQAKAANDDNYDAFYNVENVKVAAGMSKQKVTLTRPFAQVNIGASDWEDAKTAGYVVENTALGFTAEVFTELNLLTGEPESPEVVAFDFNTLPDATGTGATLATSTLTTSAGDFDHMAMAYVLVPEASSTVKTVDFKYVGPDQNYTIPVNSVPVQRNHRTNIVGKFFTTDVDYKIVIDEIFEDDDINIGAPTIVKTADQLIDRLLAGEPVLIPVGTKIDLSEAPANVNIPDGAVITINGELVTTKANQVIVPTGSTVTVNGTGTFHTLVGSDGNGRGTFQVNGGTLNISDVTLISDNNKKGSGIYVSQGGTLNAENITVDCGFYGIFAENSASNPATVNVKNSTIHSTSSSTLGSWAYAVRIINAEATFDNTDVDGIQGGISADNGAVITINGGIYTTHNSPGNNDGFYPVYVCSGGKAIINDGKFKGCRTINGQPNNAVFSGNNDSSSNPFGIVEIYGGLFSSQAYDQKTNGWIAAPEGYQWKETGNAEYPWTVEKAPIPSKNAAGEYVITSNEELGYTLNNLVKKGGTFNLDCDVDMSGIDINPDSSTNPFVFDGNGHTISNIAMSGQEHCAIFGRTTGKVEIRNLTVKNSSFSATNNTSNLEDAAGVLLSFNDINNITIENVTVDNVTVSNAKYAGILVGYSSGNINIKNCEVKNSKLISAFTKDGVKYQGHAGAIIGYFTGGTISNCGVSNTTFDVKGARGGIFVGSAQSKAVIGEGNWVSNNSGLSDYIGEVDNRTDKTTNIEVR